MALTNLSMNSPEELGPVAQAVRAEYDAGTTRPLTAVLQEMGLRPRRRRAARGGRRLKSTSRIARKPT